MFMSKASQVYCQNYCQAQDANQKSRAVEISMSRMRSIKFLSWLKDNFNDVKLVFTISEFTNLALCIPLEWDREYGSEVWRTRKFPCLLITAAIKSTAQLNLKNDILIKIILTKLHDSGERNQDHNAIGIAQLYFGSEDYIF